ncbi:hypothetical protein K443DRAFT_313651, partial [Laccaria amethystina LaAM-08-1]
RSTLNSGRLFGIKTASFINSKPGSLEPKHLRTPLCSSHPPHFILMDSFATLSIFFAAISGPSDIPTNADDGGSGNNAYCVVA